MFSMTKSRELDEVQSQDANVNKRHYGENVKFYPNFLFFGRCAKHAGSQNSFHYFPCNHISVFDFFPVCPISFQKSTLILP